MEDSRVTHLKDDRMTISNIVTIGRFVALPFIVYFLVKEERIIAFIIMMLSLVSDAVDGYLARKLHQESDLGKCLDPLADKISLAVIVITLILIKAMPFWAIIIFFRDFLILLGSYFILKNKSIILTSNVLGKVTGFIFGAVILAFTLNFTSLGMVLLYISIPAIVGTFTIYTLRYIKVMKGV